MSIQPLVLFVITMFPHLLCAQSLEGSDANENLIKIGSIAGDAGVIREFNNRYEGVKGSPYYHDEWLNGEIELKNGKLINDVKLKFNLVENELIIRAGRQTGIINRELVRRFSVNVPDTGNEVFGKYPSYEKNGADQYYRILYEGKAVLLEYIKIVYEKANFEGGYALNKTHDEFKHYPSFFYISNTSGTPAKTRSGNKAFVKIFPDHETELLQLIKKNQLDLRKTEDMIQVFRYYDQF